MFVASQNRFSRPKSPLRDALILLVPIAALLLDSAQASAQSSQSSQFTREITIDRYALSFGPETPRTTDGRWDRDYLAQIRFQTGGRTKKVSPADPIKAGGRHSSRALADSAHSKQNAQLALNQVVALESELWKGAHPADAIANNRFAELPPAARASLTTDMAYGPQLPLPPRALEGAEPSKTQLAECEAETAPTVTVALSSTRRRAQSEATGLQVTLAQDRPAESC